MKSVEKPVELQNVHAQLGEKSLFWKKKLRDSGHCERINDPGEQSEHNVNTDRLKCGLHLDNCGRGLSMNQVQNG